MAQSGYSAQGQLWAPGWWNLAHAPSRQNWSNPSHLLLHKPAAAGVVRYLFWH